MVGIIISSTSEQWELCTNTHYHCPVHGKCPAILATRRAGVEVVKTIGTKPLFYCHSCGMVKSVDVWSNCMGFAEASVIS